MFCLTLFCLFGMDTGTGSVIRKPGAMHKAHWMSEAIIHGRLSCFMKETRLWSTWELLNSKHCSDSTDLLSWLVYIQSWFTSRSAADAAINDIHLTGRLTAFDDKPLKNAGLNVRHSWYLSPELATLALFSVSPLMTVENMTAERCFHLIATLPSSISNLYISHTYFDILDLDDSFLSVPVSFWPDTESFKDAVGIVSKITCVSDCAEHGVALISDFNACTKDETQKQYMLQVTKQHRNKYKQCNLTELCNM